MNLHRITHKESGAILAQQVKFADNFWLRLTGLMFTNEMKGYDGILFEPGNSIQTCFMRYPIDVVFLTKDFEVVKVVRSMKPWRFTRMYLRAHKALEVAAGSVPAVVQVGSRLEVSRV